MGARTGLTIYEGQFDASDGYLDFAAIGPPGQMVRRALDEARRSISSPDRPITDILDPMADTAKASIARLLGTDREHATYVSATSEGLSHVAFGLMESGGNVVVPSLEFAANRYPWLRVESVGGPKVRLVEPEQGRITPDLLAAAIDADTRAVSVSLVDYATGFRADIEAIADVVGNALLVVDAIQGLGAMRVALDGADMIVAGGQKWLRAGFGAGVMAVSDRLLEVVEPTLTGWWIVSFRMPETDPVVTAERLAIEGFFVSPRAQKVRVSPHASTPMHAIEGFLEVLDGA